MEKQKSNSLSKNTGGKGGLVKWLLECGKSQSWTDQKKEIRFLNPNLASWLVAWTPSICLSFCCHYKYSPTCDRQNVIRFLFSFYFLFFSRKEHLAFCVGPRLYWHPYAPAGLHSQGCSIRGLWLTSNDHQHHCWHGTMLAHPRMHHNITEERVKGPCNYLVKTRILLTA